MNPVFWTLRYCSGFALMCSILLPTSILAQTVRTTRVVAHRGASFDAPENTLAAFRLAWKQQADGVEGDFYLSRDGHIVCIHDDTTERTSGVNLSVADSTLAELRQLDVGSWKNRRYAGEKIPTLPEVLETVPQGKLIVIELKVGPEIVPPLKRVLNDAKFPPEQVLIISFKEETIAESKRVLPNIKAHWLTGYKPDDDVGPWTPTAEQIVKTMNRIKADGLGSQARRAVFNENMVQMLRKAGVAEFHVWTVDNPVDAEFYESIGAYGVTTNRPDVIHRELFDKYP